jgi:hypothetical protein
VVVTSLILLGIIVANVLYLSITRKDVLTVSPDPDGESKEGVCWGAREPRA